MNDPLDIVKRFGVLIVEVPDLRHPAIYVEGHDIGLVRSGLTGPCREAVADYLLSASLTQASERRAR